jgi:hypothetical protein
MEALPDGCSFQKYVTVRAYPDYLASAFLVLVNKEATATVDGLNQFFKVKEEGNSIKSLLNPDLHYRCWEREFWLM